MWFLAAAAPGRAQNVDPKAAFTEALARFSLALDGAFGDEGPAATASLASSALITERCLPEGNPTTAAIA